MLLTVPVSTATPTDFDNVTTSSIHFSVSDEKNQNFTVAQQEYLFKHALISHANGIWCQELMRDNKFNDGSGKIITLPLVLKTKHSNTRSWHQSWITRLIDQHSNLKIAPKHIKYI